MPTKTGFAIATLLLSPVMGSPAGSWKGSTPQPNAARASQVKKAFQIAWDGYYRHAFPHDTLMPISVGTSDDR